MDKHTILGLGWAFCSLLVLPAGAQSLSDLISAYNGSDLKQAVSIGEELVERLPKDGESRYYLARSYMKLGHMGLAEEQLRSAMTCKISEELKANCISALTEISQNNCAPKSEPASRLKQANTQAQNTSASYGAGSRSLTVKSYLQPKAASKPAAAAVKIKKEIRNLKN